MNVMPFLVRGDADTTLDLFLRSQTNDLFLILFVSSRIMLYTTIFIFSASFQG